MEPQQNKPSDQETQVKIVLECLINKLEKKPIPCLDAQVMALFITFNGYNLNDLHQRYRMICTDDYLTKIQTNKPQYDLDLDYAMSALDNAKKDHYKTSS